MNILQPEGWKQPSGYANGVLAEGRLIFVAGQIGWNAAGEFTSDDFTGQVRQALLNIVEILAVADATPEMITRMTWYVVDKHEYLSNSREIGNIYREVIGSHFPAMSLLQVSDLLEDRARVEIEATAVVPINQ